MALVVAIGAARAGLPLLAAILGLGMLLGSDGPGGIAFDDANLARIVGVIGLVAILWDGGLTTRLSDIRPVLISAGLLATVGVAVTGAIAGVAAFWLFDLTANEAALLGAIVGATDAAAVFAALRASAISRRLRGLLEAESGLNDPMALALTVGLLTWIVADEARPGSLVVGVIRQLAAGLAVGLVLGALASWALRRLPRAHAPFLPVASLALAALSYGAADLVGGSGFLSVYLVALRVGNASVSGIRNLRAFHQGLSRLSELVLFGVLGLLVFPRELGPVILPGLALAAVLVFVARPVAVWLSTLGQGFTLRERVFVSWAGLRGAVPIVLATFALSEGRPSTDTIFNAVFFVVLASALVQGPLLGPIARRLGLTDPAERRVVAPIEVVDVGGAGLTEFVTTADDGIVGRRVRELGLPRTSLVAVILRGDQVIPPRGSTEIVSGDRLYVIAREEDRGAVEERLGARRDAIPPRSIGG